jgi:hypothetical protein
MALRSSSVVVPTLRSVTSKTTSKDKGIEANEWGVDRAAYNGLVVKRLKTTSKTN